jgi:hypothetical protein
MKKGILIRTNGKVEAIEIEGLKGMQGAVDGNIECALTGDISEDEHWDLWGNEEGRLLELPMNQVARVFIAEMSDIPIEQVFSLHGDFLLLGHDGEGESIDCPQSVADIAMSLTMFNEPFTVLKTSKGDEVLF